MIPLLRFYFHKDIRTVAAESLPYLLDCVKLRDNDYARQLWQYMNKQLFQAIEIESDHEVLGELFLSLTHVAYLLELTPVYRGSRENRRYTAGIPSVASSTA
ncbi:unnamed protein product, partial [Rotaria sp. Silwood1]